MKYLVSSLLYFFGLMLLCVFCLILFEDKPLDISLIVTFVSWTLLYAYNDKLVLVYLSAREVIDTDEQELFQRIKNEVYKTNLPLPKVYLYSGNFSNCFITESRGTWSIVLEKNLLRSLSEAELEAVVKYAFDYKKKASPLVQTKVMGLSSLSFLFAYGLVRNIMVIFGVVYFTIFLQLLLSLQAGSNRYVECLFMTLIGIGLVLFAKKNGSLKLSHRSIFFRVLSLFLMGLARPVFAFFDILAKRTQNIEGSLALKPIVNRLDGPRYDYDQLMVDHLKDNFSIRALILEHLESFPVLENCSFE